MDVVLEVAALVLHQWPLVLLFASAVMLSVLIQLLDLNAAIGRALERRGAMSIVASTAVGSVSPFCSYTIVPVIAGLLRAGTPLPPVMAFWMVSPTMDPEIFVLSVALLGWPLALWRMVAALALGLAGGFLSLYLCRRGLLRDVVRPAPPPATPRTSATSCERSPSNASTSTTATTTTPACAATATSQSAPARGGIVGRVRSIDWRTFWRMCLADVLTYGRWLVVAFVLHAAIELYVPKQWVATSLGSGNLLAIPIAALVAIPLYLTNVAALPIVAVLLDRGMQPGAAIAFLMAGPVTTVPAMGAVWTIVTKPVFWIYLATGVAGSMVLGVVTNLMS